MSINKELLLKRTPVIFILSTICCFLWGSAFPFVKIGSQLFEIENGDTASQILFAGTRFFIAGILTILIGSIISKKFLYPKKENLFKVCKLASMQTVLQYIFFYIGLSNTTGVKSSVIDGAATFFAILFACFIFKQEKFNIPKLVGCVLGLAGIIIVNFDKSLLTFDFALNGEGFILISTVAYAFSSVMIKQYSAKENPVTLAGYQFLFGGLFMIIVSLIFGGKFGTISLSAVFMLIYLGLLSAVAYSLWGILLKYNPVSKITVFGFMIPVFGFFLSAVILKEGYIISIKSILSLILVCSGIIIVNRLDKAE